ncbi:TPA: cytochrome d ubiquinol oxidase subunit II [Klebsiella pneumoniae]|jgi:cytochrome d ubiquinol oxidase subunit II|uniref:Cytochrome d ubiquinol oxidase subunit II n=1 Tax=Salmonella enterica TaxID=28901 RepID=A0A7H0RWS8_SALER|nr:MULTISPECIES: cytochrome d ubiquinol oxidase subunit II [Enterobacteriaceae]ECA5023914.1 cytochrome d ubiquinol oxidase subunit II [Salmonella enterica subsp. enterica serovar Ohio]ECE8812317.1 cytochrome d ubiquinol oxidase subunit II [Salmonella enterica subsp. enterica serovar Virchow]EDX3259300.1 cytochrome d ubiquinol oxidase subunit II [Salmonella enterica subsp. enterica serovar Mbandaka]EHX8394585.1 cytochrome d ubiquinol oxidase subunit II [Salmonella enterica subsp. enterica serova
MDMLTHTQQFLTVAWWLALGFSVLLYIMLDGADLGAGIFSLFVHDADERGAIMSAMAGTWDANETWLVVAGGIMFGTFPFVYGSAFSYLMVPFAFVLWGIMSRAVALEFRHLASPFWQHFSDHVFGIASLTVTFFGGMSVGAVLQGFSLDTPAHGVPHYVGGAFSFISPFSIWTGISSCIAMTLSGVLFVRARFVKSERIRQDAARWTTSVFWLAIIAVVITWIWSAVIFEWARVKWFGPNFWIWGVFGLLALYCISKVYKDTLKDKDFAAILWFNGAVLILGLGMLITMFPWLVPGTWTIWAGASPQVSLITFTLTMGGFLPVMIMYNWYQIWVFRGRISSLVGYGAH